METIGKRYMDLNAFREALRKGQRRLSLPQLREADAGRKVSGFIQGLGV